MSIEVRQAVHPDAVRHFDTAALRRHFLIARIFEADAIPLTYSHVDRLIVGGAMPVQKALKLETSKPIGQAHFLARRELGIFNIGGTGRITCDGAATTLEPYEALYVPMGTHDVIFESLDPTAPAKFYIVSCPAHQRHALRKITRDDASVLNLGTRETANQRTLYQMIIPGRVDTCQLVMGMTFLEPGSVWNTMPCHTHDRRCEAYLYFNMNADMRVFHMMGEPQETRHLIVANEQAILSPGWSIHSGVGTAHYGFIWAMAGDNMDFADMDHCAMSDLR